MSKSILVYFKSENDAETTRAELQKLKVSDLFVDHLPEGDNKNTYTPIDVGIPADVAASETSKPKKGVLSGLFSKKEDPVTHLIQAKVAEEDYDKVMEILAKGNGYVEQ